MLKTKKFYISGVTLIVFVFAILLFYYFWNFEGKAMLSQLGDFLSGTLGLVLTVIFAVIAYYTYRQQVSTTQRQSFDDRFFKMLELHIGYVKAIKYREESQTVLRLDGHETFKHLYGDFKRMYKQSHHLNSSNDVLVVDRIGLSEIQSTYEEFNSKYIEITGPFIKHIYYLLKYIDNNATLKEAEKIHYSRMVRTELSQYEALILFYAGLSRRGYPKLKPLLEKYSILSQVKHVKENLVTAEHEKLYSAVK